MDDTDTTKKSLVSLTSKIIPILGLITGRAGLLNDLPFWQFLILFAIFDGFVLYLINLELKDIIKEYNEVKLINLSISVILHSLLASNYLNTIVSVNYAISLSTLSILSAILILTIYHNVFLVGKMGSNVKVVSIVIGIIVILITASPVLYSTTHENRLDINYYPSYIFFPNTDVLIETFLIIRVEEGQIWNLNVTLENANGMDVYVNYILRGNFEHDFMSTEDRVQIPVQVYCPSYIQKGVYSVEIQIEYLDYLSIHQSENAILPVYVIEPPIEPPAMTPWSTIIGVLIVIAAAVGYFYYTNYYQKGV